jgi:hypothetical protein
MFKAKRDAQKFIDGVPMDLEIVNTGSTFSMYGFDYRYFGKRGFNFAIAPQPLSYDLKILEQYKRHIAKGAVVVVVVVCPFGFSVDKYENDESNDKYYFFLDKEKINHYRRSKEFLLRYCPIALALKRPVALVKLIVKKLIGYDKRDTARDENIPENVKKTAAARISSWKRQFNLPDVQDCQPSERLRATFEKASDALRKILDLCLENEFRPVVINMPACKEESEAFSDAFIEDFYGESLRRANVYDVPVIDYFRDKRFHDHSLYINADCFNDKGREFFAKIFIEDLKKLGLWEQ